jgi:hypothetical protein
MPSIEKRQRRGKEREIMECVKDIFLNSFPHPKKQLLISYQPSLKRLVVIHQQRFLIERCFQDAKTSLGMADYQVRKWNSEG